MSNQNAGSGGAGFRGGPEVDIGLFSRVQQLIHGVRLTQDERIAVQTSDVASEVHVARKEFEMGHVEQALRAIVRVSAGVDQKVAQWESRARQKESQKRNLSMLQIRKMNSEHAQVRARVELLRGQLRRLRVGLDQLNNSPPPTNSDSDEPSPPQ